jgi:hypothetical protein
VQKQVTCATVLSNQPPTPSVKTAAGNDGRHRLTRRNLNLTWSKIQVIVVAMHIRDIELRLWAQLGRPPASDDRIIYLLPFLRPGGAYVIDV